MELAQRLRPITYDAATADYARLCALPCDTSPGLSLAGTKTLDKFFLQHRLRARIKHRSFAEAMDDVAQVAFLTALVRRYKPHVETPEIRHLYSAFQLYFGAVNQFRPAAAKWIYRTFAPTVGILDFSAGWGGRALAAASLGIPYHGVDSNTKLVPAYARLMKHIKQTAPFTLAIAPAESVDFSRYAYDLVFTSPPYWTLEEYEGMPVYETKEAFAERFLRPVVAAAWRHLRPGGHLALNMPRAMTDAIADLLPPMKTVLSLPKRNRHAGMGRPAATEDIFVWAKPA